jgi:hypothetical protein
VKVGGFAYDWQVLLSHPFCPRRLDQFRNQAMETSETEGDT